MAIQNNGLAERQNKIKLTAASASSVQDQYEEAPLFSVVASGENIQYQWMYKDPKKNTWTNIAGGILPNLMLSQIPPSLNAAKFKCKIYNEAGEVYSDIVTLTVNQPMQKPVIVTQPQSTTVDPKTITDVLNSVYASVVVDLNGGGSVAELYATSNIDDPSPKAVPMASAVKSYVANVISQNETARKVVVVNETDLAVDADGIVTWNINHNLHDEAVLVQVVEQGSEKSAITCVVIYDDADNITLKLKTELGFSARQLMAIISK